MKLLRKSRGFSFPGATLAQIGVTILEKQQIYCIQDAKILQLKGVICQTIRFYPW